MGKFAKTSFLLVGTVIGAGYASGRETLSYFKDFGSIYIFIVVFCVAFYAALVALLIRCSRQNNAYNLQDLTEAAFGKNAKSFQIFPVLCYLILFSAMLSGSDALLGQLSIGKIPVAAILYIGLVMITLRGGISRLVRINGIMIPLILFAVSALSVLALSMPEDSFFTSVNTNYLSVRDLPSVYRLALYLFMNMFLAAGVIAPATKDLTKKEIIGSIGFSSVILALVMVLSGLALLSSDIDIQKAQMPMMIIAVRFGNLIQIFYGGIIAVAFFTTMTTSAYPVVEYMFGLTKSRNFSIIIVSAAGFLLSRLGFVNIVNVLYPVTGVVSVVFIILLIKNTKKNKQDLQAFSASYVKIA